MSVSIDHPKITGLCNEACKAFIKASDMYKNITSNFTVPPPMRSCAINCPSAREEGKKNAILAIYPRVNYFRPPRI